MRKYFLKKYRVVLLLLPLILIVFSLILLQIYFPKGKKVEIRSRAAGESTLTVCPNGQAEGCTFMGGEGIQQAVDAATDGDTVFLKKGIFTRKTATGKCFVDTKGKSITIKGDAATAVENHIDSQNDEIGTGVPGLNRIGICISGGNVSLESFQISHTLNHALSLSGAQAVIKNVYIVDIDGVPSIVLRGSSQAIFANSFIQGQIYTEANSDLIVAGNTFYQGRGVILNLCDNNAHTYQIVNNIFDSVSAGISGKCVAGMSNMSNVKISNNLVHKQEGGCDTDELCSFAGKIEDDPLFNSPGVYNGDGWTGFADMHVKEESPAKSLGMYVGACAGSEADSSGCQSFIAQLKSQFVPPATPTSIIPTSAPTVPIPTYSYPTSYPTLPNQQQPQITYYLPPTVAYGEPNYNQPNIIYQQPVEQITPTLTPTITPTIPPIIDMKKTVENTKSLINNLIQSVIKFTQTILP